MTQSNTGKSYFYNNSKPHTCIITINHGDWHPRNANANPAECIEASTIYILLSLIKDWNSFRIHRCTLNLSREPVKFLQSRSSTLRFIAGLLYLSVYSANNTKSGNISHMQEPNYRQPWFAHNSQLIHPRAADCRQRKMQSKPILPRQTDSQPHRPSQYVLLQQG